MRRKDILSRMTTLTKLFSIHSDNESTLQGKNVLPFTRKECAPRGAHSFLLEDLFSERFGCTGEQTGSDKRYIFLVNHAEHLLTVSNPPYRQYGYIIGV